jgi:hypothetical protein
MNILLVYPEMPNTFSSFEHVLRFISKRAGSARERRGPRTNRCLSYQTESDIQSLTPAFYCTTL